MRETLRQGVLQLLAVVEAVLTQDHIAKTQARQLLGASAHGVLCSALLLRQVVNAFKEWIVPHRGVNILGPTPSKR